MWNARGQDRSAHLRATSRRTIHRGLRVVAPLLVVVLAGGIAYSLMQSAPRPERQSRSSQARLVETVEVSLAAHPVTLEAWGHVQPARRVTLRSQVEGGIVEVSPELVPGGRFAQDDVILRIDPADYVLAVQQRQSDLAKARAELALEEGNQAVARQEYDLLGETITDREKSLVLRLPQLTSSKANVATAAAALAAAKLALGRTVVKAPFDALVLERHVDLGANATIATDIATLVGTDEYWVELAIPVTQLRWILIPEAPGDSGSAVKLSLENAWGKGVFRSGTVIRLLTDLEAEGRLARVLVAVPDPLNLARDHPAGPPVLLGTYLRAEIHGRRLDQVARVDRRFIREHETVWIVNSDNALEIRHVTIPFHGRDHVFVSDGLRTGDRVITSDLPVPAAGMPLRPAATPPPGSEPRDADAR